MHTTLGERPAKRVRQACEPCRRKKAKCPGEQPVCSLCARLHQTCTYAEDRQRPGTNGSMPAEPVSLLASSDASPSQTLEDRLGGLETKMGQILDVLGQNVSRQEEVTPSATPHMMTGPGGPAALSTLNQLTPLPMWETVLSVAKLYLTYCESQPLPLFHRETFLASIGTRDPEVIYSMLALGIRFSEEHQQSPTHLTSRISGYTEVARSLVMKRVLEGPVELSTLQCLCLLSLVDFTNGNTHRSSVHSSLAMNLAQCANLGFEMQGQLSPVAREERRRCFWSICLMKRLHGVEFDNMDFPDGSCPNFPESPNVPPQPCSPNIAEGTRSTDLQDRGIIAYVITLSEVFAKTARYVRRHGKPTNIPPWSSESEYSKIITLQMEMESHMPYIHRFKPTNFSDRTIDELQANRDYWGPFLLNQFLYHTILCLLNHPLLLSLSLRNFRSSIPEIFLQHTSDLISSHTTWIIYFLNFFEERSFLVSDPFLGYSAAVVATIELQLSFTENPTIREEKRDRFFKCVRFVQTLGQRWPHMARMVLLSLTQKALANTIPYLQAHRLQRLEDAVSATYQPESGAQNKSLLIDLSRFWEILEYSSNSDSDSARRMFGDSLYSNSLAFTAEVSQTSPLPEPTRMSTQQGMSQSPMPHYSLQTPLGTGAQCAVDSLTASQPSDLLNDEFSILAANFFSQGQEFLRSSDNREGSGNL